MIKTLNNSFIINTKNTTYVFSVHEESKLLIHNYYGEHIDINDTTPLFAKLDGGAGTSLVYEGKENLFIDNMDLEISTVGKGDYRESFIMLFNEKLGFTYDFKYQGYKIYQHNEEVIEPLPHSKEFAELLKIELVDEAAKLKLNLYYKVFVEQDVIAKYAELINESENDYYLERLMSNQLDLRDSNYTLMTFDGSWGKERHVNERVLANGIYINDSKTGVSSNRHNPLTILRRNSTSENIGEAIGFNLVYSGNHQSIFEVTVTNKLRVLNGINYFAFKPKIKPGEKFITPECIVSYSNHGLNGLSQNFHDFINHCIIPKQFENSPRPVIINNWEGTYFNFNESKLLKLAKAAKKLGIELFVLDDGWFGNRNNDKSSLGDYSINRKKLPRGLTHLVKKINAIGLDFGLWVEPEMISEDSDLYRAHPSWAVKVPNRTPSIGRNQMVLDLTNKEVQDYVIDQLTTVFSSCNLKYVKWDFNRPLSDMYSPTLENNGEFFHAYIQGLYRILEEITTRFPHVLFESCASGGNRFDLGMLCYTPQIWTSDNTDYYERLLIQTGTSYGYPLSCISNHVSAIPNHQTLRNSPLSSRFNNACFGLLGYELNLLELTKKERMEVKEQVEFYKKYREVFQYGKFYRNDKTIYHSNVTTFQVINKNQSTSIVGFYQGLLKMAQSEDIILVKGIKSESKYEFYNLRTKLNVKIFGGLLNYVLPIRVKMNGLVYKAICYFYKLKGETENYQVKGNLLMNAGIRLKQQYMGTGFNDNVRVLGDFGSRLYIINEIKED
jgi:alpha-galactosidase